MASYRRAKVRKFVFKLILVALIVGFLGAGLTLVWAINLELPDFNSFQERVVSQSTKIYDRTGKILLYDVHGSVKRQLIPIDQISVQLKNASVAIEDSEFFQHHGVKPLAIIRGVILKPLSGQRVQGGSTITQQLVKNSLLTQDRTIARKIKELILALKMEQTYDKEKILELYLNEIPYGGNIYGAEEASQSFFGKSVEELTLPEAAFLAAIPQAPTYYSPYGQHLEQLVDRKNLVLQRMREVGFITPTEEEAAKKVAVTFVPPQDKGIKAPHFVMFIKDYLEKKYGEDALERNGYKVTTTLDWDLQNQAEQTIYQYSTENVKNFNAKNAGLVAIDPQTGQILSMVGSRDYFDTANQGNFNITLAHRQPGSSFKPFVYAAAFNKGYTPDTVVFDLPTQFDTNCKLNGNNCYKPSNYDDKFRGPIRLRDALAQSINIPAIKTLYLAGMKNVLDLALDMGITSLNDPSRYGLTLVLGGGEVSLLEMTSAYGGFANEGTHYDYTGILKIEDASGQIIEEFTPRGNQVLPANIAREISSILSSDQARSPTYGLNSPLHFPGYDVAVKTGTTNDYKDAWIIGYNTNLVVGTWAGNNDNTPMERKIAGLIVAPMWHNFFQAALKKFPGDKFNSPDPRPTDLKPVLRGYWQGGISYYIDKISGKLATDYTPDNLKEEKIIPQVHSILYWINKDDPLGPAPTNPQNDPQFALWEKPIRDWVATSGIPEQAVAKIPTEKDDIHLAAYQPKFNLTSPTVGQNYTAGDRLLVAINSYSGKFPFGKLEVFLDDDYLGSSSNPSFSFNLKAEDLANHKGSSQLKVIASDTVGNRGEKTVEINLKNN